MDDFYFQCPQNYRGRSRRKDNAAPNDVKKRKKLQKKLRINK